MYKRTISVIMSVLTVVCCLILPGTAVTTSDDPVLSDNISSYTNTRWASPVKSHLYAKNGEITRVEIINNSVITETYDSNYNLIDTGSILGESAKISGVYCGNEYNFIVCSQDNYTENDNTEVAKIIKYSKSWERLDSVSIFGANTTTFAYGGSLRFLEYGNYLYIYTCHEMYKYIDGYNHQANMLIILNTDNMTITQNRCEISNNSTGYVSHSFNQFIAADESTNSIIAVDHGDDYPRSIAIFRYNGQLGNQNLTAPEMVNVFDIAGEAGDNETGVSIGDVIVTDSNYIIAFNSIRQGGVSDIRTPYLAVIPKNSFKEESVKLITLTSDSKSCGYPYITAIGNGKYNVMWECDSDVYYVTVDKNGTKLTGINSFKGLLSDCEPIFDGSKIMWYATNYSAPIFYSINTETNNSQIEKCFHDYDCTVVKHNSCEEDGLNSYNCSFCDDQYEETVKLLGHTDGDSNGICDKCNCYIPTDNTTVSVNWEKSSYYDTDEKATLNITAPYGVYLQDISSNATYRASWNSVKLVFNYFGKTGTYYIYLKFNDGQVVQTKLTVIDSSQTETTTEVSTTQTTESTTQAESTTQTTESTTQTTEASTSVTTLPDKDDVTTSTTKPSETQTKETTQLTTTQPSANTEPTSDTENTENTTEDISVTLMGDMDGNGRITASDARTILRISAQLHVGTDYQIKAGDMDGNGKITASDARKVLRISAQLDTL